MHSISSGRHLHAAAGGVGLAEGLGVDLVHRRKVIDIGQEDDGLDHIGHAQTGRSQDGLEVGQALGGLLLHGIGHQAGGGVHRNLTRHKDQVA